MPYLSLLFGSRDDKTDSAYKWKGSDHYFSPPPFLCCGLSCKALPEQETSGVEEKAMLQLTESVARGEQRRGTGRERVP